MSPQKTTPFIRRISPALIILTCLLTYWNAIGNGFTYDDHYIVESNALVKTASPLEIFTHPLWQGFATEGTGTYYRPLVILSYSIEHALYGLNPTGFHSTNVVLHVLTTLLVFLLARRLIRSDRSALAAALLFSAHPVLTEAVSSVAGRSDLLVTLFSLTALLFHLSRRAILRSITFLPLLLALFSKEIGLVLPVLLVTCDILWPRGEVDALGKRVKQMVRLHAKTAGSVVLFGAFRWYSVGNLEAVTPSPMDNPLVDHGFWISLFTLPSILGHYARLLLYPASLSIDYGFNQVPVLYGPSFGLLATVLLLVAAYRFRVSFARSPTTLLALAILALPVLVIGNPFFTAGSILSERYLYLPTAGLAIFTASLVHRFRPASLGESNRRRLAWCLLVAIMAAAITRTVDRNADWETDEQLFGAAVAETPNSVRANLNYAEILASKGDHLSASRHYAHVLSLKPDYPIVNLKLARALQLSGRPEQALYYYAATTRLNPGFTEAWSGLATLSIRLGRDADAENALKQAISLTPDNAALYNQLGVVYQRRGRAEEALEAYELALARDYQHPGVYCNLGIIYKAAGEWDRARLAFSRALVMAPDMALVHYHLGKLEEESGNRDKAISHFEAFLARWDQDPDVSMSVRHSLQVLKETS